MSINLIEYLLTVEYDGPDGERVQEMYTTWASNPFAAQLSVALSLAEQGYDGVIVEIKGEIS